MSRKAAAPQDGHIHICSEEPWLCGVYCNRTKEEIDDDFKKSLGTEERKPKSAKLHEKKRQYQINALRRSKPSVTKRMEQIEKAVRELQRKQHKVKAPRALAKDYSDESTVSSQSTKEIDSSTLFEDASGEGMSENNTSDDSTRGNSTSTVMSFMRDFELRMDEQISSLKDELQQQSSHQHNGKNEEIRALKQEIEGLRMGLQENDELSELERQLHVLRKKVKDESHNNKRRLAREKKMEQIIDEKTGNAIETMMRYMKHSEMEREQQIDSLKETLHQQKRYEYDKRDQEIQTLKEEIDILRRQSIESNRSNDSSEVSTGQTEPETSSSDGVSGDRKIAKLEDQLKSIRAKVKRMESQQNPNALRYDHGTTGYNNRRAKYRDNEPTDWRKSVNRKHSRLRPDELQSPYDDHIDGEHDEDTQGQKWLKLQKWESQIDGLAQAVGDLFDSEGADVPMLSMRQYKRSRASYAVNPSYPNEVLLDSNIRKMERRIDALKTYSTPYPSDDTHSAIAPDPARLESLQLEYNELIESNRKSQEKLEKLDSIRKKKLDDRVRGDIWFKNY